MQRLRHAVDRAPRLGQMGAGAGISFLKLGHMKRINFLSCSYVLMFKWTKNRVVTADFSIIEREFNGQLVQSI